MNSPLNKSSVDIARGVWPVMLTPFTPEKQIDWNGLERLTNWYIDQGVQGLFAACLSSESLCLSAAQRVELAKRVIGFVGGRVPVVAGVMGFPDALSRAKAAHDLVDAGAAAAVITLCDVVPQADDDNSWIAQIRLERSGLNDIPLGFYECPVPYHRTLTPALAEAIGDWDNLHFLKETTGNVSEMLRKKAALPSLRVFSASSGSILEAFAAGIDGFCGLQGNLWPALFVRLFNSHKTRPDEATMIQSFLREYAWMEGRAYPASAKRLLSRAHGLDINPMSFLNHASVSAEDDAWIDIVIADYRKKFPVQCAAVC